MYYNVFGEKISKRRFKEMCDAAKNRRELIAAGLTSRRDLVRMRAAHSGRHAGSQERLERQSAIGYAFS